MEPCHFAVRPNDSPMPPCPELPFDRVHAAVPFMARLGGGSEAFNMPHIKWHRRNLLIRLSFLAASPPLLRLRGPNRLKKTRRRR